jgi:hypothetical protein
MAEKNSSLDKLETNRNLTFFFQKSTKIIRYVLIANLVIISVLYYFYRIDPLEYIVTFSLIEGALLFIISPLFLSMDLRRTFKESTRPMSDLEKEISEIDKKHKTKMKIIPLDPSATILENETEALDEDKKHRNELFGKVGFLTGVILILFGLIFDFITFGYRN